MPNESPPAESVRTPSYRRHKATGQSVVTLNGKDVYLGKYNTAPEQGRVPPRRRAN